MSSSSIKVYQTHIPDLIIIEPTIFKDERGYFLESYSKKEYIQYILKTTFVQDNESFSKYGVLRGLHYQCKYPQGKLVKVAQGDVFDVAVDLRKNSKFFGQHFSIILSSENKKQMYIPPGFAHGFIVLSNNALFQYKCTEYYHKEYQRGIIWNDNSLNIHWPIKDSKNIILSEKDKRLPTLDEIIDDL